MNPWLQFLGLIPGMAGMFMHDNSASQFMNLLSQYGNPQKLAEMQKSLFNTWLGSPAYSSALGSIGTGVNAAQGSLATALGRSGLSHSGLGSMSTAIGSGLGGLQVGKLNAAGWNAAGSEANDLIQSILGGGKSVGFRNIPMESLGAMTGALGTGLDSMNRNQMFQQWLKTQGGWGNNFNFGNLFSNSGWQGPMNTMSSGLNP